MGSGAGGGGSGGGAGVNTDGLDEMQDNVPRIPELLAQAAALRKNADKEEEKANQMTQAMQNTAAGMTTTPPP